MQNKAVCIGQSVPDLFPYPPLSILPTRLQKEKEALGREEVGNVTGRWGSSHTHNHIYLRRLLPVRSRSAFSC